MSCCFSFHVPKALPSLFPCCRKFPLYISSQHKPHRNAKLDKAVTIVNSKLEDHNSKIKFGSLAIQLGALLAAIEQPVLAVTGVNNEEDLTSLLIQSAVAAFWYFIIMPPIVLIWLWRRFYRRKLLEMYLQFMCVFLFFPGIILWAPFLNFRKFPMDPSMKYPWSTPNDRSKVEKVYRKYPFATPEDYD